jgi:hypothetical protein
LSSVSFYETLNKATFITIILIRGWCPTELQRKATSMPLSKSHLNATSTPPRRHLDASRHLHLDATSTPRRGHTYSQLDWLDASSTLRLDARLDVGSTTSRRRLDAARCRLDASTAWAQNDA